MRKYQTVLILLLTCSAVSFCQTALKVYPETLQYKNQFERLQHLVIYNDGNESLKIDSIYVDDKFYFARFDIDPVFPFTLHPGDSIKMDCLFWNYWNYTYGVYDSAIVIYGEIPNNIIVVGSSINIDIDIPGVGEIVGEVLSGNIKVPNAKVLFYRNGTTLTDSTTSDNDGNYTVILKSGNYFASVEKEGYYLSYNLNRTSPLDADFIELKENSVLNIDFELTPVTLSGYSIRGNIFDKQVGGLAKKKRSGVVVASRGDHNPSKESHTQNHDAKIFTGIIYSDGSYSINNIIEPGYYYLQAFSEYFVPGYYSGSTNTSFFWQTADSVYIDKELNDDYNIYLERDSSYGAGIISGKVYLNSDSNFVNTIVYAQSENGKIYSHNFVDANGNYKISGLPFGKYKVVAQLIGYNNAVTHSVIIDEQNTSVSGMDIQFEITGIDKKESVPNNLQLFQNYPNPFNPETIISFSLNRNSFVTLKIYDLLGNEIGEIVKGNKSAGIHRIIFNTADLQNGGMNLSSGVYFYRLLSHNQILTRKMVLLR